METTKLKRFAQYARRSLIDQVEAKLKFVLMGESAARRENPEAVKELEKQIQLHGQALVIDKVAYTWFNRFCALRFMDVNGYTRIRVASPLDGQFQPEILAEAKMGHIDEDMVPTKVRDQISALLSGNASSNDPQQEAYRLLVVAVCNDFHRAMPYLFERIADYTELLMPDDLLSGNSILAYTREAMTPDACQDVEVIGWLYQFYISEKKDEVFDGLKKNKKITPENIPAATQLFTPHWIVRYLVENSLGRLWMLNNPSSKLVEKMDYYIKPQVNENEGADADFLRINKPEDIKVCDPACGSGHILTYTFDLLYAIYEEAGTDPSEISGKILTHNLYGIEIDERAGELAAFALTMKARAKQRRFFNKGIRPNICVLQNVIFDKNELNEYVSAVGRDLFTQNLSETLTQFEEADNFGSLIQPKLTDVASILPMLEANDMAGNLFLAETHRKVILALKQADYLNPRYHVLIANPPYLGGKGMNGRLSAWAKENYPDSKSDMFSMFIERGLEMLPRLGYSAMVTMQGWMFLTSYEKLRSKLIASAPIECMAHMASMVMGIAFGTSATVWKNQGNPNSKGAFCYIEYANIGEDNKPLTFPPKNQRNSLAIKNYGSLYHQTASADFKQIPSNLIAYWLSDRFKFIFKNGQNLAIKNFPKKGLTTGNNDIFIRLWFEISYNKTSLGNGSKWYPMTKGGTFRKWFGNNEYVVDWEENGKNLKDFAGSVIRNENYYLKEGGSWNDVTQGSFSIRYTPPGFINNAAGPILYSDDLKNMIGLLNSAVSNEIFKILSPTMKFEIGSVAAFPILDSAQDISNVIDRLIKISKDDWDSSETSWNFATHPLLGDACQKSSLTESYRELSLYRSEIALEMQKLEENVNLTFIRTYGLENELPHQVLISEVTLTNNPYYRYDSEKNNVELEFLLRADTIREFISYAAGCMFGRYSLNKDGLILVTQGASLNDYLSHVPEPKFMPDVDNVIPMLDGDWFPDDISERFRVFLRMAFGEVHYEENLHFIENALGKNGKPLLIRDYFLKEFYNDHIKRYKKRPIYWLFSSPKGSFNALIYMHRYRPDTVSVILNDYLREFRTKLSASKDHLEQLSINQNASSTDKTKSLKELEILKQILVELDEYEREVLYPLATQQIDIDLDDGVKVNYLKFGSALKKIPGLDAKDED